jgi:hypothetical protein
MTIHETADQLHRLSVAGYINGEKFTVKRLENQIAAWFRASGKRQIVMEIALPDGRWFFTVNRFSDKRDGYDYTIPDDREQEARIKGLLG